MKLKEMLSVFFSVKELKTIWKVERDGKEGYLSGTAHFFPYSLKKSLLHYIRKAKVVLFEGPLDDQSMNQVIKNGS
ncbi:MAG: TraB/GumN family protein, partial [Thermodesulfobacteriota bacterium]|nr:TraB/GumN family protein [Thermodesulfobacteriota bacterium]